MTAVLPSDSGTILTNMEVDQGNIRPKRQTSHFQRTSARDLSLLVTHFQDCSVCLFTPLLYLLSMSWTRGLFRTYKQKWNIFTEYRWRKAIRHCTKRITIRAVQLKVKLNPSVGEMVHWLSINLRCCSFSFKHKGHEKGHNLFHPSLRWQWYSSQCTSTPHVY